jgi:pyruvate/2-oxoglutarate dehydrogenase complex dihydrolipoamide dehydrogenase (E3) component
MMECDYLIIGGGNAGIGLAESLNKLNKSIVLIEAGKLGGGTLNNIDIPKKEFYKEARNFNHVLNYISGKIESLDSLSEAREVVSKKIHSRIIKKHKTILNEISNLSTVKLFFGEAALITKNTANITLDEKKINLKYKKCLLCIGNDIIITNEIKGLDTIEYLTKYTIFQLVDIPQHLAIIGLTQESLEIAAFYSNLGIEVSIFEKKTKSQILQSVDRTMASFLVNKVLFNFVNIYFETNISEIRKVKDNVIISSTNKPDFKASHLYMHVDEKFDTTQTTVQNLRLKCSENGLFVDNTSKTNNSNIYAFGSCVDKKESKKIVKAKIKQFVEAESRQSEMKHKKLSTQLIINTTNLITHKPQQEKVCRLITFEMEYFLDSIGVGLSEVYARGKYGPKVKIALITNKQQSEFVKIIYFVSSKKLIGYWATSYFKTHFHSMLSFAMITKSSALTVIDTLQSHMEDFEIKIY